MCGSSLGDTGSQHVGKKVGRGGLDGALRDDLVDLSKSCRKRNCITEAYEDTFCLGFFMQLGSQFMHPHMFSGGVDVGRRVVDAGLDDLSAISTKGLSIVNDTPSHMNPL